MNATRQNTTCKTHVVAPEEVMAYLDGELAADEAEAVAAHLRDCGECAAVAEELRGVSRAMDGWKVELIPASLEREVREAARDVRERRFGTRRVLVWGGVIAALLIVAALVGIPTMVKRKTHPSPGYFDSAQEWPAPTVARSGAGRMELNGNSLSLDSLTALQAAPAPLPKAAASHARGGDGGAPAYTPQGPMIARTVSLTLLVKNVAEARGSLDALVSREQGYAAQLTFSTPEAGSRSLQASLRVPAGELATALEGLRKLGRVQEETQSGEEVTQQHADLVARLKNSREEEGRLRDLLAQRTGKIEDVLQVEEEIARVRGEIEGMEAEQKGIEHRVDFASVELKLVEEYKAQLGSPATDAGTQVHNSFVTGLRNAGGSLLGMLLFLEEVGPVMLIWGVILGVPGWLLWRRYRRAQASLR